VTELRITRSVWVSVSWQIWFWEAMAESRLALSLDTGFGFGWRGPAGGDRHR